MGVPPIPTRLRRLWQTRWLGPHFFYDMIRLARKGWPTLARVFYLVVLLISLTVMYRTQRNTLALYELRQYAQYAHRYAYTIIVLQDLLVLLLLPAYVASVIAEEKEKRTLEALTLTHLTDRELVLGKFGARLMHLGAVVLSAFPLLAFMHLWGNVSIGLLAYHEACTFLLLLSAGSVCTLVSAYSETAFQAVTRSYPWLVLLGAAHMIGTFTFPWGAAGVFGGGTPLYLLAFPLLLLFHGCLTALNLHEAVARMDRLRREERRGSRKNPGAFTLADDLPPERAPGKRGQVRSRIHRWAWPIGDDAVFWKECIKDGTSWSLRPRWLWTGIACVAAGAVFFYLLPAAHDKKSFLPYTVSLDAYFVSLAAYALVVLFQMTQSVAGEREQDTLTFLLLIPEERRRVLFMKWLGPWWRNWPILAIAYLGIAFGTACAVYNPLTTLLLLLLPWPLLLMLGGVALWLSVVCRRVLFANLIVVGLLGLLVIVHVALGKQTMAGISLLIAVIGQRPLQPQLHDQMPWTHAAAWVVGEQLLFLLVGALSTLAALRRFTNRDYGIA